jgi:hypothetical protein
MMEHLMLRFWRKSLLPLPPLAGGEGWGEGGTAKYVIIFMKSCNNGKSNLVLGPRCSFKKYWVSSVGADPGVRPR